jgi:hypothetical protein
VDETNDETRMTKVMAPNNGQSGRRSGNGNDLKNLKWADKRRSTV